MQVNNVQSTMQNQMMLQIFQQMLGDSDSFQIVLQSLMNASTDGGGDLASSIIGNSDLSKLGYGGGTPLNNAINDVSIAGSNNANTNGDNTNIEDAIQAASLKYKVDPQLIRAVITQESSFNPYAVSKCGAEGLMQLMPGTAAGLGVNNSFNVDQNVDGGTKYLKGLLDMYGNTRLALAAYNAGPNALSKNGVDNASEINKLSNETKNYVSKVMEYYGK